MAKRERNKRAARKARQAERERVAEAREVSGVNKAANSKSASKKSASAKPKAGAIAKADRKGIAKVTGYFSDVRTEMRQVTWPARNELRSYSVAVIIMLIIFGAAIWLIDTGFVAALVQFTGLRG